MEHGDAVTDSAARAGATPTSRSMRALTIRSLPAVLARPENGEPLAVFVLSRVLILAIAYFGVILFNSRLHDAVHPSFLHQLLPRWDQWDTAWYIAIAQRGYGWKKAVGTSPTAFFPLYPILLRGCQTLLHRSYTVTALLVSNVCFLGALLYLWRLAAWELLDAAAGRAILYISVFPTALFFFAGYSESTFLLSTVASFYYLRRRQWFIAGLFAAAASATRVTGVLLVLPLAYDYARHHNFSVRSMLLDRGVLGVVAAPCGLFAFMAYLAWKVGDPIAFSHGQAAWQKVFTPELWAGFLETARQILIVQPEASFYQAHNIIEGAIGTLFLVGSVLAARRLPASYGLYLLAFWIVTLSEPALAGGYPVPLISLSRYVLSLFPVFMYMGMLGQRRWIHDAYLVSSAALLSVLTVQFINGGWII